MKNLTTIKQLFIYIISLDSVSYFDFDNFIFTIYYNDLICISNNDKRNLRKQIRHFNKQINYLNIGFKFIYSD